MPCRTWRRCRSSGSLRASGPRRRRPRPRRPARAASFSERRMRVSYVGHATLLLDFGGTRLLTDPNYDSRLAGVLPRVSRPGIALEEMPRPDAVLLSHAHADHLSFRTLDRLPRDVPVVAPPALARWLDRRARRNGRRRGGTIALAPGASLRVGGVAISAGAAWHMGARYGLDRWRGASNMYLIDDGATACLFAG